MAGGGGSTGGIGAQSPAVNPPNPMGQIGDAVGGALGNLGGGQPQTPMGGGFGGEYSPNPMGGLERPQVSYFGDNMLSNMGNNTRLGNNMSNMPGNYGLGNMAAPPAQSYDQYLAARSPMQQDIPLTQDQFNLVNQRVPQQQIQGGMGQQQDLQQAMQQAQAMQQQGGMGQQLMGLAGLLGGMPNQPVPTAPPVSTTQPAPMAQPAPVAARPAPMAQPAPVPTRAAPAKPSIMGSRPAAKPVAKPVAKPSVVPPKTPPAVASAIQKLAAKKQIKR